MLTSFEKIGRNMGMGALPKPKDLVPTEDAEEPIAASPPSPTEGAESGDLASRAEKPALRNLSQMGAFYVRPKGAPPPSPEEDLKMLKAFHKDGGIKINLEALAAEGRKEADEEDLRLRSRTVGPSSRLGATSARRPSQRNLSPLPHPLRPIN